MHIAPEPLPSHGVAGGVGAEPHDRCASAAERTPDPRQPHRGAAGRSCHRRRLCGALHDQGLTRFRFCRPQHAWTGCSCRASISKVRFEHSIKKLSGSQLLGIWPLRGCSSSTRSRETRRTGGTRRRGSRRCRAGTWHWCEIPFLLALQHHRHCCRTCENPGRLPRGRQRLCEGADP